jgi:hypothetical protein
MVYILPPQLAGDADNPSYLQAYNSIVSVHRNYPLASSSSVIMLVAPDVDALCAARMLATLFKQDDVGCRILPIRGKDPIVTIVKEQLLHFPDVCIHIYHLTLRGVLTIFLVAYVDINQWRKHIGSS